MGVTREDLQYLDQLIETYARVSMKAAEYAERWRFGQGANTVSVDAFTATQQAVADAWSEYRAASVDLMIKAAEGEELTKTAPRIERPTISTLEEIQDLPKRAVILEDQYQAAYQKMGDNVWTGEHTTIADAQIDLPCTVIYDPRNR